MMKNMIRTFSVAVMTICVVLTLSLPVAASVSATTLVQDNASLLSSSQLTELQNHAKELSDQNETSICIVTEDGINGNDLEQYEEDYFNDNDMGYGSSDNGLMLMIDMDSRKWNIMTFGDVDHMISSSECSAMGDDFVSDLSDGNYYDAFDSYLTTADYHLNLTDSEREEYNDGSSGSGGLFSIPVCILFSLVVSLIISFAMVSSMKRSMNTRRLQSGASAYLDHDSFNLTRKRDIFLYFNISKTPRPKANNRDHDGGGFDGHGSGGGSF